VEIVAVLAGEDQTDELDLGSAGWRTLSWMCDVLSPLHDVSKRLEPSHKVTISLVIPIVRRYIQSQLPTFVARANAEQKLALVVLEEHLKKWFTTTGLPHVQALLFDPRFHSFSLCTDEEKKIENALEQEIGVAPAEPISDTDAQEMKELGIIVPDRNDEFSRYKAVRVGKDQDPLEWWKANHHLYPRVAALAKKYLCPPATSVPSERTFSLAKFFDRAAFYPDNLELCVLIHHHYCELRRQVDVKRVCFEGIVME